MIKKKEGNIIKKEFVNGTLIDREFYPITGQCIVFGQNINIKDFVEDKVEIKCPWGRTVKTKGGDN